MLLTRTRLTAASLIIASAVLFTIGVAAERNSHSEAHEQRPEAGQSAAPAPQGESTATPEHGDGDSDEGGDEGAPATSPSSATSAPAASADSDGAEAAGDGSHESGEASENVLGINPESTPLVAAAVTASVLLALALLTIGSPLLVAATSVLMLAFAALDIREVAHQIDESRTGLAIMAAAVTLLHLSAAAVCAVIARRGRDHSRRPTIPTMQ